MTIRARGALCVLASSGSADGVVRWQFTFVASLIVIFSTSSGMSQAYTAGLGVRNNYTAISKYPSAKRGTWFEPSTVSIAYPVLATMLARNTRLAAPI